MRTELALAVAVVVSSALAAPVSVKDGGLWKRMYFQPSQTIQLSKHDRIFLSPNSIVKKPDVVNTDGHVEAKRFASPCTMHASAELPSNELSYSETMDLGQQTTLWDPTLVQAAHHPPQPSALRTLHGLTSKIANLFPQITPPSFHMPPFASSIGDLFGYDFEGLFKGLSNALNSGSTGREGSRSGPGIVEFQVIHVGKKPGRGMMAETGRPSGIIEIIEI